MGGSRKSRNRGESYEIVEILKERSLNETLKGELIKKVIQSLGKNETDESIDQYCKKINSLSGIQLTQEEAQVACNILLESGYGSIDVLERELERRKSTGIINKVGNDYE